MSPLEIAIGIAVVAAVAYAVFKRKETIAEPVAETQEAPYKVETPAVVIPPEVVAHPHAEPAPVAEKAPAKKPRAKKEAVAEKPAKTAKPKAKAKATKAVVKKAKIRVAK